MSKELKGPQNTIQFIWLVIKSILSSIPQIIKGMVISAALSFAIANAIHFYLMGWVNDGWNMGNDPVVNVLIFANGQQTSPKVMLFYFLISYVFWWVIGMFRTRGIATTIKKIVTTPVWVSRSLVKAGLNSFAMLMGGITISFIVGLTLLTGPSSIMMFLLTITWLVSQDESLIVLGLQFGFKDLSGLISRGHPSRLPDKSLPVVGILGSAIGFAYMTFFNANTTMMAAFIVLTIGGIVFMYMRNRNGQQVGVMAALLIMVVAASLIAPVVYADDGGIRENGGWGSVTGGSLLRDVLISRGIPASLVALLGSLIASLSSPPSVWGSVENLESYAEQTYPGANRTGGVVDYGGDAGPGLPQSVIDAEDSEHYGDGMKIYTQPVPTDQGQMDDIAEGISNLGTEVTNNLHPDVWKNLTSEERAEVLNKINEVLNDEFGTDQTFETYADPSKPNSRGSYDPNSDTIKLNSSCNDFDDPRKALRTIIHEARHSYQYEEADADGNAYEHMSDYNYSNYNVSSNDYVAYGEQFIERDARNFGANTTNQVINSLNVAGRNQ
jgi:hypothetical protein